MKFYIISSTILLMAVFFLLCIVTKTNASDRSNMPLEAFSVVAYWVDTPPKIDGILNEAVWQKLTPVSDFTQYTPAQEDPASERTYCYIAYDSKALYFAARCEMEDPSQIVSNINNRDAIFGDDWIALMIDSYGDRQSAFEFFINPVGIQGDAIQHNNQDDISWDAVWKASGQVTETGWIVEAEIPFTALRFSSTDKSVWRFQIIRRISRNNEMSFYVPMRKSDNSILARTAELTGLEGIGAEQNVSVAPYVTQKMDRDTRYSGESAIGADLKYAPKSNLILDVTLNPDFGHIEADVEEINLSPYELQLMEKRPFFLEKTEVFNTLLDLFYSRRIIDPSAGFKVTGQENSFGFGALYVKDQGSPSEAHEYDLTAVRASRSLLTNSQVGCLFTSRSTSDYYNRVAAADWNIKFNGFKLAGQVAKSWSSGRNRLAWMGYGSAAYIRNDIKLAYGYGQTENNFISDVGYVVPLYTGLDMSPVSYRKHRAIGSYTWQINNGWLRRLNPSIVFDNRQTYSNEEASQKISVSLNTQWEKNIIVLISANKNRTLWERKHFKEYSYSLAVSANPNTRLTATASYSEGQTLNYWEISTVWQRFAYAELDWTPTSKLHIAPALQLVRQYHSRGGEEILAQTNHVLRIGYTFSPILFTRIFFQHNSASEYYAANFLLGFTYLPGSTFYLAYNSGYMHTNSTFAKESEIIFAKLSYYWDK